MADIKLANSKKREIWKKVDIDLENNGYLESKILEFEFITQVFKKLSEIESIVSTPPSSPTSVPIQNSTTEQQQYTHMPKIQCTKFSGEEVGKFEFKNFLAQFENCVTSVKSQKVKISLLKSFLTGYTSQLIENLSHKNENYDVAINLLKKIFLHVIFIINEMFKQILNYNPKFDPDFVNVRKFLSGVNTSFQKELIRKFNSNYPKINQIKKDKFQKD